MYYFCRISWKLADFGIAKLLTMTAQQNYYTDTFAGKHIRMVTCFIDIVSSSLNQENSISSTVSWVGVNCSKFDCSTIICSTLLAGNQLPDTKFINCSNPVNACLTGFEQMMNIISIARIQYKIAVDHFFLLILLQKLLKFNMLNTFCS